MINKKDSKTKSAVVSQRIIMDYKQEGDSFSLIVELRSSKKQEPRYFYLDLEDENIDDLKEINEVVIEKVCNNIEVSFELSEQLKNPTKDVPRGISKAIKKIKEHYEAEYKQIKKKYENVSLELKKTITKTAKTTTKKKRETSIYKSEINS